MTAPAVLRWRTIRESTVRRILSPPPKLTVSQWAEANRVLSRESSAEPGEWQNDRTPYGVEIMDSFNDPTVHEVVFMKCARIGGTSFGENISGYFIDLDPCPILIVMPTVDDAKQYSKESLAYMIRDTPCLAEKVKEPSSRVSDNTIQSKAFPGGRLTLIGANSGTGFRRRTIRYVHNSEVDGFPPSAGGEGDQLKLAKKRTDTYANYKIFTESTPKIKGLSRIADAYEHSDQRRYLVPCPDCGHKQALTWKNLQYEGLEVPLYCCEGCGSLIEETDKFAMIAAGQWVASNPGHPVRGYHINALYSPFPGARWANLVEEWREAQGNPEKLQTFVNLALGETWDSGGGIEAAHLATRTRFEQSAFQVPLKVGLLTCGVDVQPDRLECSTVGWGPGEETWQVHREIIHADTSGKDAWVRLDAYRKRTFPHESGATMTIGAMAVDYGYNSEMVSRFCTPRHAVKVYMVKGHSEPGKPIVPRKPTTKLKWGGRLYMIGADAAKDWIYGRLKLRNEGPGYVHFPLADWCDEEYFKQLAAERATKTQVRGTGRWVKRYVCLPNQANEALDCFVYALAAFQLCGMRPEQLPRMAEAVVASATRKAEAEPVTESVEKTVPARQMMPMRLSVPKPSVKNWR